MAKREYVFFDEPLAFCEFEAGVYFPWNSKELGHRRPERVHAVFFQDGSVFDAVNGLTKSNDPEEDLYHVRRCLQEEYWKRDGYKIYDRVA